MRWIQGILVLAICSSVSLQAVTTIKESLYSEAMGRDIEYVVVLPDSYNSPPGGRTFPVLYCLHGYGSPYDTWAVMSPLNSTIDSTHPAILVTFEGETSFYVDNPSDPSSQFGTFFLEELVPFIESTYRAGKRVDLRAVTGFSMGGFGAWHYMLEKPDFFSSVSALSGAFDFSPYGQADGNPYARITHAASDGVVLPPLYLNCGTLDSFLEDSRQMAAHLGSSGYPAVLIETPDYGHEWSFWRDVSDELLIWHYQYMSAPVKLEFWSGHALYEGSDTDTGEFLGWINAEAAPWIWVYNLAGWAYAEESDPDESGGWVWIVK